MATHKFISKSEKDTIQFARDLVKDLEPGSIICLIGDLGAGKTTFVKGLAKGLKLSEHKVSSPTFVIMNIYEGKLPIYHFDLYRLEDEKSIMAIGYEEFFYGEGISVIEWADRLGNLTPKEYLKIELKHKSDQERTITVKSIGQKYEAIINRFFN